MPEDGKIIITSCTACKTMYQIPSEIIGKEVTCKKCKEKFTAQVYKNEKAKPFHKICYIAVHYNICDRKQIAEALAEYNKKLESGDPGPIENFLLEKGILTEKKLALIRDIEKVWDERQLDKQFCAIAVKAGFAAEADTQLAIKKQAAVFSKLRKYIMVGDILIKDGVITEKHRDAILKKQNRTLKKVSVEPPPENSTPKPTPPPEPEAPPSEEVPSAETAEESGEQVSEATDAQQNEQIDPSQVSGEIFDGDGFEIIITEDKLKAYLRISSENIESLTLYDIHKVLDENFITYGVVKDEHIKNFLETNLEIDKMFLIAEGTPPEEGKAGEVLIHFDTSPPKAGRVGDDGQIDFKDRGEIPHVEKGELLAEKTPSVQGIPGIDVFGNPISVTLVDDPVLLIGSGVTVSEDGLKVLATVKGQPQCTVGGKISVLDQLRIDGDVGYKTGHIEFEGNIFITGSIQNGFKVKGGNVTATEINGAEVEVTGELIVADGITDSVVNSLGSVNAKYINKSEISTFGDVIVSKQIVDSTVTCGGACRVPVGKIIASEVSAKYGIEVLDVGTDISSPCKLKAGVDDHLAREIDGINSAVERSRSAIKELEQRKKNLLKEEEQSQLDIAEQAHIQDRSQIEQRNLRKQIEEFEKKGQTKEASQVEAEIRALGEKAKKAEEDLENLFEKQDKINEGIEASEKRKESLESRLRELLTEKQNILTWSKKEKGIAVVKASGTIYAGTTITGVHSSKRLAESIKRAQIKEVRITDPDSKLEYEMRIL